METFRVVSHKEIKKLGPDFNKRESAEDFARNQNVRPLSVVRVINKGKGNDERYESVTEFLK